MVFNILSGIFALIGIYITIRIYKKKRTGVMVCPLGSSCQHVLFSKYSKLLGVDIEYFGFVYYLAIFIGSLFAIFTAIPAIVEFGLLIATIAGFAFSLYLTMIQAFYIKNWCVFCVSSAITSTLILISSGYAFHTKMMGGFNVGDLLASYLPAISLIQLIAVAVGVASVTVSSLMIIKFLGDFKIDEREDRKINVVNQITWVSILLLIIVNVSVFTVNPLEYLLSDKWIAQAFILVVLILNTAIFDMKLQPNLIGVRLDLGSINVFKTFWMRQNAFAATTISIISWYMIMLMSFFNVNSANDSVVLISYYITIIIVATVVIQIATLLTDRVKVKRKRNNIPIAIK
jgi:uncharacterized membrane protein